MRELPRSSESNDPPTTPLPGQRGREQNGSAAFVGARSRHGEGRGRPTLYMNPRRSVSCART
eukprot:2162736-Rhodomonas_salina.1